MFDIVKKDGALVPMVNFDREFDNMFEMLDNTFSGLFRKGPLRDTLARASFPKVNVRRNGKDIVLEAAVPYYDPKDISLSVKEGVLTLAGKVTDEGKGDFISKEVSQKAFTRSWTLPVDTKEEDINAEHRNGVLYVTIKGAVPKPKEEPKARVIDIKY